MALLKGFDVSHYQGSVDWASLKSSYGITWGAAKATEGRTYQDSQFPANWRKMKAAGLVRMAYHFAHPDTNASLSAMAFLNFVKANGGIDAQDVMVMDMESNPNNLPLLQVRDWLIAWADIITQETGRKPFIYVGSGYIADNVTLNIKPHYAAWWFPRYPAAYDGHTAWPATISGYPATNNWGGAPDIWQFSATFAGALDANVANMTLDELKGITVAPVPPPPPSPPSDDWLAMATPAELSQAVEDGIRAYLHDFFTAGQGTGDTIWKDMDANAANLLAAVQAVGTKLDALIAALTPPAAS